MNDREPTLRPAAVGAGAGAGAEADWRARAFDVINEIAAADNGGLAARVEAAVHPDAEFHLFAPLDEAVGPAGLVGTLLEPLRAAMPGALRRDEIFIGGRSRARTGTWTAALGHYVGTLEAPLFGVPASGHLAFLRYGEFTRWEDGVIVEARILWDLLDLLRQAGRPLPQQLGTEITFPGPATRDGVLPSAPERSDASAELVEAMLDALGPYDPSTFESVGLRDYWHPQMVWYGPGGIGSNFGFEGFQKDHRIPFLQAFPDRAGQGHYCRFGNGDYVCSSGWPSLAMTHAAPYLGVPATGRRLTMRVMDFWRCEGGTLRENWVLLDLVDILRQLGVDAFAPAG